MAEQTTMKGRIVAATAKPYSLTDKVTKEVRTGTAYAIWLVSDFSDEPTKVKVRQADIALWNEADDAGPNSEAACVVSLSARDNRLERTLVSLTVIGS